MEEDDVLGVDNDDEHDSPLDIVQAGHADEPKDDDKAEEPDEAAEEVEAEEPVVEEANDVGANNTIHYICKLFLFIPE